jgi:hypothetical protein
MGTLSKRQVPETSQSVPEQATATTSSTQGGLPVARGKSAATTSTTGLTQEQEQAGAEQAAEFDDDIIEEIQGHPQDGHQHVYICRKRGDHYVYHEEISIDKEIERVERAARRLIGEVQVSVLRGLYHRPVLVCGHIYNTVFDLQDLVKMAKYHKRCFDQIQGNNEDNKELTAKVDGCASGSRLLTRTRQSSSRKGSMLSSSLARKSMKELVKYLSRTPPSTEKCCSYVFMC